MVKEKKKQRKESREMDPLINSLVVKKWIKDMVDRETK